MGCAQAPQRVPPCRADCVKPSQLGAAHKQLSQPNGLHMRTCTPLILRGVPTVTPHASGSSTVSCAARQAGQQECGRCRVAARHAWASTRTLSCTRIHAHGCGRTWYGVVVRRAMPRAQHASVTAAPAPTSTNRPTPPSSRLLRPMPKSCRFLRGGGGGAAGDVAGRAARAARAACRVALRCMRALHASLHAAPACLHAAPG